jgi:hypothetical protein
MVARSWYSIGIEIGVEAEGDKTLVRLASCYQHKYFARSISKIRRYKKVASFTSRILSKHF